MSPAVSSGDHVFMEGISFLFRPPRRGDIVVFRTEGIASVPDGTFFVKRIAGQPGEHVQIGDGDLLVNEKRVVLSNAMGKINYVAPAYTGSSLPFTNLTVPGDCYFVLGDVSTNSYDSRYWGTVPRKNIMGRVFVCYWPPGRMGTTK
jgi:signal peptidase I